tara:strand:- start:688 stop:1143 length:456 start_codon:yes stop_codon:yes gene_type:complete
MAKTIITKTMVQERIAQNLAKGKVYVKRLGKNIIPTCAEDLPPRMRRASIKGVANKEYIKAHSQLYYELVTKPGRAALSSKVLKESILVKSTKKVAPTPLMLAETPKASPMKGYKEVARTGRVESKKLVINMSSTMTCTILNSGLITVDFK